MKTDIAFIYALLDPTDGSVRYIGKTVSPKRRIHTHISESIKFNHHRARWIRSLVSKNLKPILKVLKICPLSDFAKYEKEYIKLYKSKKLTNSDETGSGNTNRKRKIIDDAIKKISRKVYQFDLNGNFIKEYKSTRDAARKLNTYHAHISRCCNGIFNHTGGFIFRYDKNEIIKPVTHPNAIKKCVIEIGENNIEINRWNSIMDCSRDTKIDNGNLSRVCNGIRDSIKDRVFRFV